MEEKTKDFVGLMPLKEQFLRFAKTALLDEKRKHLGYKINSANTVTHFIFQGNPGTGKTTFARIVADLLHAIRKIEENKVVEVQRGDLVGQYIGATEEKTRNKIREAKGGVLFVDEAYRLNPRSESVDYGRIAINQLMASMENGDPVMIFAGYPKEMSTFLQANPGLKSRLNYKFNFPDYSGSELAEILAKKVSHSGYRYNGRHDKLTDILVNNTSPSCRSEQNGRLVKNIVSEAIINLNNRLSFSDSGPKLITLEDEDIVHGCKMFGDSTELGITDDGKANPEEREEDVIEEQEKEAGVSDE